MNVKLRPLADADAPLMFEMLQEPFLAESLENIPQPYTLEDAKAFVFFARGKGSSGRDFAIDSGGFAGVISLEYGKGLYSPSAELGLWLGRACRGKGASAEAIRLAAEFAFEKRKLSRVFARTLECNAPCRKALERAGFSLECVQQNAALKNCALQNVCVYSLVRFN